MLRLRSPIRIKKHLVTRVPEEIKRIDYDKNLYKVRILKIDDINRDEWLRSRERIFKKMLNEGHIGYIVLNKKNECIAYSWIAINNAKPNHLPRIPKGTAWIHFSRVREEFRGKGIHRIMMYERNKFIKEKLGIADAYADTFEDNIPSRINQKRLGFIEQGIYYTVEIGTRKIPFLFFLFGKWNKNKKHPEIKIKDKKNI